MARVKHNRCSRKKQTLAVLATVIGVFCMMQMFSLFRLSIFQRGESDHVMVGHRKKADRNERRESAGETRKNVDGSTDVKHRQLPRGVPDYHADLYRQNKDNIFTCHKSMTNISFSMVNDDFCDCEDSSDEPGTSACPDSRFYCDYQILHEDSQFIVGSRVNDGLCDCCDGSDEWEGRQVPHVMHLSAESQRKTIAQSPCPNTCADIEIQLDKDTVIQEEGKKLCKEYIEAAKTLSENEKRKYGPDGVFYKLSSKCYEFDGKEYEYTVCPFVSVKQQKFPKPPVILGRKASLERQTSGNYVLLMKEGDGMLCPLGTPRRTRINFICGLKDEVVRLTEKERCSYAAIFSTPAACI